VTIAAGETTERSFDLQLGEVVLDLHESAGKPFANLEGGFAYRVFQQGDRENAIVSVILTNTATLQLPGGFYDVVVDVPNTELISWEQPGQTFEVTPGQSGQVTINLGLGRLQIEVVDEAGQPVPTADMYAYAYPTDQPDREFAYSLIANPLELPLRAGVSYDIWITLASEAKLALADQQVQEGELRRVTVSVADFK
jgi:hypothetical protein